ncbi:MAG TPA: S8/S53 family peptidase, partial [Cyclobacteriaceae bacterium]
VNASGGLSGFSSIGPTSDNRIKPDVVALGSNVSVIKANGAIGTTSGTSVAAPLVTSLVAGLMQVFPELKVSELYQLIIASADLSESPNNQKGYGVPNYVSAKIILGEEGQEVPSSAIHIYPNPATGDVVKIKVDTQPGQLAVLQVFNVQGSILMESEGVVSYVNNPIELDLSELNAGLYILKVEIGNILKTVRLIKF